MQRYTIRQYTESDLNQFLSLYERVFSKPGSVEWFEWKYVENDYLDHVPIFVAELYGNIVGARPFFALELTDTENTLRTIQPCDTMVHPEHRGQGLFTNMTEYALNFYRDKNIHFVFNFPNSMSKSGYLKMGWEDVTIIPRWYRFNDLHGIVKSHSKNSLVQVASRLLNVGVKAYNSLHRYTARGPTETIDIEVINSVPSEILVDIYEQSKTKNIHAVRDQRFYRWRFANPRYEYRTFVAKRDDTPIGAVVVGDTYESQLRHVRITELVPRNELDPGVAAALMEMILNEYEHADLLSVFGDMVPEAKKWGFVSDQQFPISRFQSSTHLITRPIEFENGWAVDGREITDPSVWSLTYAEWDTS